MILRSFTKIHKKVIHILISKAIVGALAYGRQIKYRGKKRKRTKIKHTNQFAFTRLSILRQVPDSSFTVEYGEGKKKQTN